MEKSRLRNKAIQTLKNIPGQQKVQIEQQLQRQLFSQPEWVMAGSIGITVSQSFEWDTVPIIEMAWKQNKKVLIPKSTPSVKSLDFYYIFSFNDVEIGNFNLLEPKVEQANRANKNQIDLLIVPGLLFTKEGYRLGFGGGYYDRFLVNYNNKTLSLLNDDQFVDELPIKEYDIPIKKLITPTKIVTGDENGSE
ncbi:5-formyltetrahydrofolate cyclo-ligase [Virgibacillus sp. W0430]|uniref:5-formyltetrahydrofolate cyclo-ligase n=1 Tax=Virgibacillus sp. W0430 TaxID=3391580 RepID=UPI003F487D52